MSEGESNQVNIPSSTSHFQSSSSYTKVLSPTLKPYAQLETEASSRWSEDMFQRTALVENLTGLLTSDKLKPPYVFALYGRWGTGKTWVAKWMEHKLHKELSYKTCWFEAWRYESEDNLLLPLCAQISKKFKLDIKRIDENSYAQFKWILADASRNLPVNRFLWYLIRVWRNLRARALDDWADSVNAAKDFFRKFIQATGVEENSPLFVFIDDLDRCKPENALKLLESIKHIVLSSSEGLPIVFILLLDHDALVAAIKHKYGEGYSPSWASDYLQKIVRYYVDLPEIPVDGMNRYFEQRNRDYQFNFQPDQIKGLSDMCVSARFHNVRKIESVLQKFHLINSIYNSNNKSYPDYRYKVLLYLFLKEFRPDLHVRIIKDNTLLNDWLDMIDLDNVLLSWKVKRNLDADDVQLMWLVYYFVKAGDYKSQNRAHFGENVNLIIRYALMIERIGIQN